MTHRIALLFQFFLFVLHKVRIRQFIILELQEILVLTIILNAFLQCL